MHRPSRRKDIAIAAALTACSIFCVTRDSRADDFLLTSSQTGHLQYAFVGNTMADNNGLSVGVNCLMPRNSIVVSPNAIPPGATLLSATLYVSGSLFDDGVDYAPDIKIFNPTPGLIGSNPADVPTLEAFARAAATFTVSFQPPGSSSPLTVSTTPNSSFVTVSYISNGSQTGNVAYFNTPIDITGVMLQNGRGVLSGTYIVDNVLADVCDGLEAVCGNPSGATCATASSIHTSAVGAFAILLIYEDPALPLSSISVFDGLQSLFANTYKVSLNTGSVVSAPALGTLTYYALGGDLSIYNVDSTQVCGGLEYVLVNGGAANNSTGLCLNDSDNPVGNIFNGTLNTQLGTPDAPGSCTPTVACCYGPHVCGLAGVDLDRYDISTALQPGLSQVQVTVGTGSDRIALAGLVMGINVFEPVLAADTQLRVFNEVAGAVQVGGVATYSIAISNTGNVDATQVNLSMNFPSTLDQITVTQIPAGAVNQSASANNVHVTGFSVAPGKVAEVRVNAQTLCTTVGQSVTPTATISSAEISAFTLAPSPVMAGGPGIDACAGLDPNGPFLLTNPTRELRGGGLGCSQSGADLWLAAGALLTLGARKRRSRARVNSALACVGAALLIAPSISCRQPYSPPQYATTSPLTPGQALPGTPCGSSMMVRVTRAEGSTFCMDRFEASVDGGALGNAQQNNDDTSTNLDGSTKAKAQVEQGATPATGLSWYQAKAACLNAGKHLCSAADWELACGGSGNTTYPYGSAMQVFACNGFFAYTGVMPAATGSFKNCVATSGAYDLSGNVEEWLDSPVARDFGSAVLNDRLVHGGSYASNFTSMTCVSNDFHAPPASTQADRGFRCCSDPS